MNEITETPLIGGDAPESKSRWGRVARWVAVLLVVGLITRLGRGKGGQWPARLGHGPGFQSGRVRWPDSHAQPFARAGGHRQLLGLVVPAVPRGGRVPGADVAQVSGEGRGVQRRGQDSRLRGVKIGPLSPPELDNLTTNCSTNDNSHPFRLSMTRLSLALASSATSRTA